MLVGDTRNERAVAHFSLIENLAARERFAMPAKEVVQDDNVFVLCAQQLDGHTADVACTTCNEYRHDLLSPCVRMIRKKELAGFRRRKLRAGARRPAPRSNHAAGFRAARNRP